MHPAHRLTALYADKQRHHSTRLLVDVLLLFRGEHYRPKDTRTVGAICDCGRDRDFPGVFNAARVCTLTSNPILN